MPSKDTLEARHECTDSRGRGPYTQEDSTVASTHTPGDGSRDHEAEDPGGVMMHKTMYGSASAGVWAPAAVKKDRIYRYTKARQATGAESA